MKFRYRIKKTFNSCTEILEKKINTYLEKNFYRVTERGPGYIIFVEDEFSNRRKARSDFHTRIGEGKFVFKNLTDREASIELIYFTYTSYYVVLVMVACALGIYINNIAMPIVFSIALAIPILYKIFYINEHVFAEIMEC